MSGKHSWKISLLPALGGEDTPVNQRGLWSFPSLPQALHFCQGTAEGDTPQTSGPFSLQLQSWAPSALSIKFHPLLPKNEEG